MKANLKRNIVSLLLLHTCLFAFTQQTFRAPLSTPGKEGFYNIVLYPELVAKCNKDLSDLRIVDQQGKVIPYILKTDIPFFRQEDFREFPILSNTKLKNSVSEIVIENKSQNAISSLLLLIKNAAAIRTATISGSNNNSEWYIVKEHVLLEEENSNVGDEHIQGLSFPLSRYSFLKITIHDKNLLPFRILKAGTSVSQTNYGKYLPLPPATLLQKDSSNKHSYITITFNDDYVIDKLQVRTQLPALYRRNFRLIDTNGFKRTILEGIVDPQSNTYILNDCKTNRLFLDISNEDDDPLKMLAVEGFQLRKYIIARFQQDGKYYIECGDKKAVKPQYDLRYFEDSLSSSSFEVLTAGVPQPLPAATTNTSKTSKGISSMLIWIVIAIVLLVLLLLSIKLIKEVPKTGK